jgi:hypothetical protein
MGVIYSYIAAGFPGITLEEIDALTPDRLFEYLAIAEKILQRPVDIAGQKSKHPSNLTREQVREAQASAALQRKNVALERRRQRLAEAGVTLPDRLPETPTVDFDKENEDLGRALSR